MPKTMLYICQAVSQVSSETTSSSSPPPHPRAGSTDTTLRVQEGQVCSITTMSLRVVFILKIYEKYLVKYKAISADLVACCTVSVRINMNFVELI